MKNLQHSFRNDPFGKMGGGAPLRDPEGHILAERGNVFDRNPLELYNYTPSKQPKEIENDKYLLDLSSYSKLLIFKFLRCELSS